MVKFCSSTHFLSKRLSTRVPKVLVLTSSYNRREKTLRFLGSISNALLIGNIGHQIILVEDNSNDGTATEVKKNHPDVRIIPGNGFLYWAGALRLGFDEIDKLISDFDGVLIANDDIYFHGAALTKLIQIGNQHQAMVGGPILTRAGEVESTGYKFGFICRPKYRKILTTKKYVKCDVLPGHVLYIPKSVYLRITPIAKLYRHGFADFELSLRAMKLGIERLVLGDVVGYVDEIHDYAAESKSISLDLRLAIWRLRFNPKAPPINETSVYLKGVSKYLWGLWIPFFYVPQALGLLKSIRAKKL
jgi:GT2 family glycosyltransferase